jgi:hypothetical protein
MADTALRAFPGSANSLASRSDARNLKVEGKVREIHASTLPGGAAETRLILVGSSQPDEVATHFTCKIDKLPDGIKEDQIIRITGSVGPVVAAAERVELLNCRDVTVVGDPTVGNRLAGAWRCSSVILDGVALRKDAERAGKKTDDIPAASFASPLRLDLIIKTDGTFASELWDKETLAKKVAGRWVMSKDGTDSAKIRLEVSGQPSAEIEAAIENGKLAFPLPGYADKRLAPETSFDKVSGVALKVDPIAAKNQTLAWFSANYAAPPQQLQQITPAISGALDACIQRNSGLAATFGSAMLKRGRAAAVMSVYGKMVALEFSDAQTQHDAPRKANYNMTDIPAWGTPMTPEVKIESLAFDKKGPLDLAQPLTGKITVRGLRRMPQGQYALLMQLPGYNGLSAFDKAVGADSETFSFRFDPVGTRLAANMGATVPVVIVVSRQAPGVPLTQSAGTAIISEPMISLMDIAGR